MSIDFSGLALPIGYQLQLTMIGQDYKRHRCRGTLVGYQQGGGFMVCLTEKPPQVLLHNSLRVEGGVETPLGVGRFISRIEHVGQMPFDYLVLAWPESLNWKTVRNAGRYKVRLPLQLTVQTSLGLAITPLRGVVVDISEKGARIALEKKITDKAEQVELVFEVPAMGKMLPITVNGIIRKSRADAVKPPFVYGIEFLELDDLPRLALHVFVLDQQVDAERCKLNEF
jgi:c-di-GMP-binding flagellar brake protein YcgR